MHKEKNNITIGVFFGSRSPEHEVSIITGQLIITELRKLGYQVAPVYVDKKGQWFQDDVLGRLPFFTAGHLDEKLKSLKKCFISMDAKKHQLVLKKEGMFAKETVIDMAFPAFHGSFGEDGTVQGVFELANVPYVGCGVAASAIAMDKIFTKKLCNSQGILTPQAIYFTSSEWQNNKQEIIARTEKLRWPLFVKPARLGSSIGIAKVHEKKELENACEVALHYDTRVLVEECVENMKDITCCVLGNNEPTASLLQEALFQGGHFSYADKYLEEGGAQLGNAKNKLVIPASLNVERTEEIRTLAVRIFKLFDCAGIARVDFLYDTVADKTYVTEINTLPGTLYHHLWKASGIEIGALLEKLITLAQEEYTKKNNLTVSFNSDLLSFANSVKLGMKKEDK